MSYETTPSVCLEINITSTIAAWDLAQQKWVYLERVLDEVHDRITIIFKVDFYRAYTIAVKEIDSYNLKIFNAGNPMDNYGKQYFPIEGVPAYADNKLSIFNKWSKFVYQTKSYSTEWNVFKGISKGFFVIDENQGL